jgi:GTP-binding protein HflX
MSNKIKKAIQTARIQESAVLVAVATAKQSLEKTREHLDELAFLAETAGVITQYVFIQKLERPDHRTYVGKGKLEEIVAYITDRQTDIVIFDDDLSPSQVKNLEGELKCKILDRSLLILNIFSQRAQTAQAKTQVELAQYQYLLPRLTRLWTHLSRQKGGIGMRGPGEKELETDRRIVTDRIAFLKEKLLQIEKQTATRKKQRSKLVRVAFVGYTNVGKSTLMQVLSKSPVFAENKLFATLDATVRKVSWNGIPFLLTDTVGFIRKLPTTLIEAFKSTLDEVREADILIHVVDASHPSHQEQIKVVEDTLKEVGCTNKHTLLVYNKADKIPQDLLPPPSNSQQVLISATQRQGIEELKKALLEKILSVHKTLYPHFLEPETFWGDIETLLPEFLDSENVSVEKSEEVL